MNLFSEKMGRPGFEPGTNRLKAEYSTIELATLTYGPPCCAPLTTVTYLEQSLKVRAAT